MNKGDQVNAWPLIFGTRWNYQRIAMGYLVLLVISPVLFLFIDQELSLVLGDMITKESKAIWAKITLLGEAGNYFAIFLLGYLLFRFIPKAWIGSLHERKEQLQKSCLFGLTCFFTSGLLVLFLKFVFGRQRPYGSELYEALVFKPFNFDHVFQSFPSGHSQVIFTLAAFLSLKYPRFNILYIALGLLIAVSRLTVFNHFLSDIIAGSFVGLTGVVLAYRFCYLKGVLPEP